MTTPTTPPGPENKSEFYRQGRRFRVTKEGARIVGLLPSAEGQQGYWQALAPGDILTCRGVSMTFGDGVPAIKWNDAQDQWICNDAIFEPYIGSMWDGMPPHPDYLEPCDDESTDESTEETSR
jgi:hypothetical protein